jgi:RNA polymerase sigma factor (sigma-70 family)
MASGLPQDVLQHLRGLVVPEGAGVTDGELLNAFVHQRDEAALAALVKRHGSMVWGVCRRLLRSHHDAEDAFQATFLVLVRKAAAIRDRKAVANWLYGVAHQTAVRLRALAAKRRGREHQVKDMPEPAAEESDRADDLRSLLDRELSCLPDKYRTLIVLCDLEGKTRKEVAGLLCCPEGTVAGRLARARSMLANRLTRHGPVITGGALAAVLAEEAAASAPVAVLSSTVEAVRLFAAGQAAGTGGLSVQAVALADGVLKAMLLAKLKIASVVLLAVAVVGAGAIVLAQRVPAQRPPDSTAKEIREPLDRWVMEKKEGEEPTREAPGLWPQWRGPNRDGVVHGVTVPTKWPATLKEEWRVEVGEGVASPAVVGAHVFVFTRQKENEVVLCLDLAAGKEIWRSASYAPPYQRDPPERNFSTGPRSTPVVAQGRIYTLGLSGSLSCLDAGTGTLFWRKDCKPEKAAVGPGMHAYGGSSPLIADGLCLAHGGDGKKGGLTAFDAVTGELKWCYSEGSWPMSGSPILVDLAGERQVVTWFSCKAVGVSVAGRKLWEAGPGGPAQPYTTPVQYKDLLILADSLQPLRAVRPARKDSGVTVKDVWGSKDLPLGYSSPVLAGDLLFGMSSIKNGRFFCLAAATGKTRWKSPGGQGNYASIVNAGNVLLCLTEKGRLIVVRPSADKYDPIAEYKVSDTDTHAHPVFLGERILIKDATTLRSLRIEHDGK